MIRVWYNLYTPHCGFTKSFNKGDECEIVETESGDWVREEGEWEWRGWVREVLRGSMWEWDSEWEHESLSSLCEREGEWEWRVRVRGVNFEKSPIWNRVLETRFPSLPRASTTLHLDHHVTYKLMVKGSAYKSSLKESISKWTPRGKKATLDLIRSWKPSLKNSVYKPKIESFRLEMLVSNIVSKQCLLTI